MSTRNKIMDEAYRLRLAAEQKAGAAFLTPAETHWNGVAGDARNLENDACESRHTVKRLAARLRGLRKEVAA